MRPALMRTKMVAAALCALAVCALTWARNDAWRTKPASDWTPEEAEAVATDSPWARPALVSGFSQELRKAIERWHAWQAENEKLPSDATGAEDGAYESHYVVRWSSAQAVQEARQRLLELGGAAVAELNVPLPPELSAQHYILTVQVVKPPRPVNPERQLLPWELERTGPAIAMPPHLFEGISAAELAQQAELRFGRRRLKPERAARHGLGAGEAWSFYFPRATGEEAAASERVEFVFRSERGELKGKFDLREMRRNGRADY